MGTHAAGVSMDGIVLGAALVVFGFLVVFSVIPLPQAPLVAAIGAVVAGAHLWFLRHQAAMGLLLMIVGGAVLAFFLGYV